MLSTMISGLSLSSSQQLSEVVKSLCRQGNPKRGRDWESAVSSFEAMSDSRALHHRAFQTWPMYPLSCSLSPSSLTGSNLLREWPHSGQYSSGLTEAAPGVLFPSWCGLGVLSDKSAAPPCH